jgi:cytochrome b6-f complex iron-sulfur subunit
VNRRSFVGVSLAAIGSTAISGCASLQTVPVTPERGRIRIVVRNYPSLDQAGGSLKILPEGWTTPLYVLATDDGYAVLSPICTHQGCTVAVQGDHLVCPCHGSTYTRSGTVLRGPAEQPLQQFPAKYQSDGVLEINIEVRA